MINNNGKYIYRNKKTGELVQTSAKFDLTFYDLIYEQKRGVMDLDEVKIK